MQTNQNHKWQKVSVHDNNGNEYNGYLCTHCEYLVVAYPPLDRESHHEPDYRLILIRAKDLTLADVDKYIKKYDVACDHRNGKTVASRFSESLEKLLKNY